jgi:hypothetical protein
MLSDHLASASPGGHDQDDLVFVTTTGKPIRHSLFAGLPPTPGFAVAPKVLHLARTRAPRRPAVAGR